MIFLILLLIVILIVWKVVKSEAASSITRQVLLAVFLGFTGCSIILSVYMPLKSYIIFYNNDISLLTSSEFKDPDKVKAINIRKDIRTLQEKREQLINPDEILKAGTKEAEIAGLDKQIKQKNNELQDIEV